jgi:outer membrane protein OmpA-like peptidoglycan-associated protein
MKKSIFIPIVVISASFLTGCLRKKPKNITKIENDKTCESNNNLNHSCECDTKSSHYDDNEVIKKSIFDEEGEGDSEIIIEREFPENTLTSSKGGKAIESINKAVVGKHIATLHFDFDVYKYIRREESAALDDIINTINSLKEQNKDVAVTILGHSCNSAGSEKYNMQLSDRRALAIKEYILKHTSVYPERIFTYGLGTSEIICSGDKAQQAPNRRAEVYLSY